MSDHFKNLTVDSGFGPGSKEHQRQAAVAAALSLIQAKVSNSPERASILRDEMANLSLYADQIQAALKTN